MERVNTTIGGLPTPVFYPSVSSVSKNVWNVVDHVELLVSANFPQFLVSCFDFYRERKNSRLTAALSLASDQSQVILYDSGIYEVVWSRSKRWNRKKYFRVLRENRFSHAFSLDEYVRLPSVPISSETLVNEIVKTSSLLGENTVSPIIHCRDISTYIDVCVETSNTIKPRLLAIPERELGFGIVEIAKNLARIRRALDSLETYQAIHILGTGNPLSMMVYAFMGADSFDGLDWCQTVVDYDTGTLHHTLHLELYAHQGKWGGDKEMSFLAKCLMHNLDFYNIWMEQLGDAISTGSEAIMIEKYIRGPQKDVLLDLVAK